MLKRSAFALVAAGLVAGLVLGSMSLAVAAPEDATSDSAVVNCGLQIGRSLRDAGGRLIDIVADLTGLSTDEVRAERQSGKSISDIAEANGVDAADVVSEALDARKALLDEKVADGTISAEDAAAMLERMEDRLSERVTTDEVGPPSWAGNGQGRRGMMGNGGQRGAGTCGACTQAQ